MHAKAEQIIRKILTVVEVLLAIITLIVMVGNLAIGVVNVITTGVFPDTESFLHNILEVLTVAIARHIIISHEEPLGLLVGVVCLAGIFAVRRYLIRHQDMQVELSKAE